eukprot:CAMPEP_0197027782 /NCGR_PEP_ID=MMETSP1384-20130603/7662_1 /TAXON_ID=29189 /ORGANISM="Ammonia sp." /LENGTH=87 /DNA_ID=CAMNT_0042456687 /DNA_START=47 /DNA_END=309 /DNA_ORIENTATION=-
MASSETSMTSWQRRKEKKAKRIEILAAARRKWAAERALTRESISSSEAASSAPVEPGVDVDHIAIAKKQEIERIESRSGDGCRNRRD